MEPLPVQMPQDTGCRETRWVGLVSTAFTRRVLLVAKVVMDHVITGCNKHQKTRNMQART